RDPRWRRRRPRTARALLGVRGSCAGGRCRSWTIDAAEREIEHPFGSRQIDRAIRLHGVDEHGLRDTEAEKLTQSLARQFRVEAEGEMRRERKARRLEG